VLRRKLSRGEVLGFFKTQPKMLVGIEACGTDHHWARKIAALSASARPHFGQARG
jgi:transposase